MSFHAFRKYQKPLLWVTIVFTVLIRIALIPLTMRQTRQMKKMQELQPKLKALQDKYKGKPAQDRRQLSADTMRLYREAGVSPPREPSGRAPGSPGHRGSSRSLPIRGRCD